MFKFLKEKAMGSSVGLSALTLGLLVHANTAKAAVDPMVTDAMASSTAVVSDNLPAIVTYLVSVWGKGFLIGAILAVLGLTAAIILGAIFRRRKKK